MSDKFQIQSDYLSKLSTHSPHTLQRIEIRLIDWLADIRRFYPWPALEQSISKDIESIWQEQKRRRAPKK